jgi:competence protein ComEC
LISIIRYPAAFIGAVAEWASHFPVLSLGVGTQGFVRIILIIAIAISMRIFLQPIFRKVILFFLILLLAMTWIHRFPSGDWQVAQCDVGQGDSLVLNLGSRRAIVIDVGPDSAAEDRCLRQLGIEEISLMILTHFHADHVQGLEGAINGRSIGALWVSTNSQPLSESTRVDELIGDIPKITVHQGMRTVIQGEISISILWPEISMRAFESMPGDGSAINNSSIALVVETPHYSLFAAGDLEPPAQSQIAPSLHHVDIYKVSHHGSKYQDETLMKILRPQVAMISVGAGNSYGHPALSTVAALRQGGARVVRTDRDGAIALTAREHKISIRTSKSGLDLFR